MPSTRGQWLVGVILHVATRARGALWRICVLAAVAQDGEALCWAGLALQADREVVLAAVAQDGEALRADRPVVLAAVAQNGWALRWAGPGLRADTEVVLAAVRQDGDVLQWADEFRADQNVMLAAKR